MLIAIGLLPATGRSDSILLKDGRILEGEVVKGDMTSDAIVFRANVVGIWTTMTFKPAEITALDVVDGDQSDRGTPSSTGSGTGTSSPAASEPAGTTEDGIRTVRVTGEGVTKALALHDACRNAVEQVTGTLILSESQIEDGELIEDKIIAFSNGKVDDFEIVESTKASDNSWSITIDAKVLVMKLIEELRVNNVTLKANVGSEAMSQLGEVVSREERDHTAAKTIKELMQYYPHCIWTVEPAGTLRTQDNRTSGGEFIVAHKVRFEITTAKWNRFANAFKRLLGEVALDRKTLRLNTPRLTAAEQDSSKFNSRSGYFSCYGDLLGTLAELQYPVEERQRIDDLPNRLGRVSIGTTVTDLRKMKPLSVMTLLGGDMGQGSPRGTDDYAKLKMGFHDTITVVDRKLREAKVYAVPSSVFDEITQKLVAIEILPLMINADGDEVGRPLHTREDCQLAFDDSVKWEVSSRGRSYLHIFSHTTAHWQTKTNPRQLVIVPFIQLAVSVNYSTPCMWTTESIDIEYPFAMTEEDMTAENLSFQV
ncbi:MAG: hypothetical protein CMJ24_00490, partial [Phycisphaerae bacterium]|nr:hypothetical protein [Phycisphaerae bacterium]